MAGGTLAEQRPTKGERTRARVLAAAIEHFAAVGLDGGSVPEIARQVGVSHSALYQHFGRKDALFRAAVDADFTDLFEVIRAALAAGAHTPDDLVLLIPTLAEAARQHPLARRVLANFDAEQADALRDLPALQALEADLAAAMATSQRLHLMRVDIDSPTAAAGLVSVALALVVVAIRLDGLGDIPRATSALQFLTTALKPSTSR